MSAHDRVESMPIFRGMRINGHKQSQIDVLLPWNYAAKV